MMEGLQWLHLQPKWSLQIIALGRCTKVMTWIVLLLDCCLGDHTCFKFVHTTEQGWAKLDVKLTQHSTFSKIFLLDRQFIMMTSRLKLYWWVGCFFATTGRTMVRTAWGGQWGRGTICPKVCASGVPVTPQCCGHVGWTSQQWCSHKWVQARVDSAARFPGFYSSEWNVLFVNFNAFEGRKIKPCFIAKFHESQAKNKLLLKY